MKQSLVSSILGDPGAVSRVAWIFVGERSANVYCKNETSPWALTEPVPEAFEFPDFDRPEKYFSAQSAKRTNPRATLMPSYTKLFSSSIATVAWAFQREGSRREFPKKNSAKSRKSQTLTWSQVKKTLTEKFSRRTYS